MRAGALHPSGEEVASGSDDDDCKVRLLDVMSQGEIACEFEGHQSRIWSLQFHPTLPLLAAGDSHGQVKIWNIDSGHCLKSLSMNGRVRCLRFDAQGKYLVAASDNQDIRLWDMETYTHRLKFYGNTLRVWAIALLPQSQTLVSGDDRGTLKFWSLTSGKSKMNGQPINPDSEP
ncbi:MAG: hypothetical protein HC810_02615 [Acaryochloridaceae cyanobacterium RL_2_7]|nr:hypothetical protein [Acaryochloridaceae cyanobacterium RL_2_7]